MVLAKDSWLPLDTCFIGQDDAKTESLCGEWEDSTCLRVALAAVLAVSSAMGRTPSSFSLKELSGICPGSLPPGCMRLGRSYQPKWAVNAVNSITDRRGLSD